MRSRRAENINLRQADAGLVFDDANRLYVVEGLPLKPKRRRRCKAATTIRETRTVQTQPNERWATDVMHDVLKNGLALRVRMLDDVCTRECVALHVATGFNRSDVAEFFSAVGRQRAKLPEIIQCDSRTEFTSTALDRWAY